MNKALVCLAVCALCACSQDPPEPLPTQPKEHALQHTASAPTFPSPALKEDPPKKEPPFKELAEIPLNPTLPDRETAPKKDEEIQKSLNHRFLLIGDSQLQGHFGRALDTALRLTSPENRVSTYAVCASNPMSWSTGQKHRCGMMTRLEDFKAVSEYGAKGEGITLDHVKTPTILELLGKHTPQVLVITLGENAKLASGEFIRESTLKLMKQVRCYRAGILDPATCVATSEERLTARLKTPAHSLGCAWVMSPWTDEAQKPGSLARYVKRYEDAMGDVCKPIDSRPLTCRAGYSGKIKVCRPDRAGIHFGMRRARLWAFAVHEYLGQHLNAPLLKGDARAKIIKDWRLGID